MKCVVTWNRDVIGLGVWESCCYGGALDLDLNVISWDNSFNQPSHANLYLLDEPNLSSLGALSNLCRL